MLDLRRTSPLSLIFIALEAALLLLIELSAFGITSILCFSSVALAFLFSLCNLKPRRDSLLTAAALLFTVLADVCLVLLQEPPRTLAMVFFLIVQMCYFLRIYFSEEEGRVKKFHPIVRLLASAAAIVLTLVVLSERADLLSVISFTYYVNLVLNIVYSFTVRRRDILFSVGLILFAACDLFVGLSMLDGYFNVSEDSFIYLLMHPPFNAVWLFYVPSQTLIALSSLPGGEQTEC